MIAILKLECKKQSDWNIDWFYEITIESEYWMNVLNYDEFGILNEWIKLKWVWNTDSFGKN